MLAPPPARTCSCPHHSATGLPHTWPECNHQCPCERTRRQQTWTPACTSATAAPRPRVLLCHFNSLILGHNVGGLETLPHGVAPSVAPLVRELHGVGRPVVQLHTAGLGNVCPQSAVLDASRRQHACIQTNLVVSTYHAAASNAQEHDHRHITQTCARVSRKNQSVTTPPPPRG